MKCIFSKSSIKDKENGWKVEKVDYFICNLAAGFEKKPTECNGYEADKKNCPFWQKI